MLGVMASGQFTMGKKVREYEAAFADWCGARHAVATNSGSSANLIAVAALRAAGALPPDARILIPAVGWSTTYAPFAQYGCQLILVDVDPLTMNICPESLARAAAKSQDVTAVATVNVLGNPVGFDAVRSTVGALPIIEDNCESMGATYRGTLCGRFGLVGTFSSFFAHHISTMEGGMAVTDDEDLYRAMLSIRAHGWTRDLPGYTKSQSPLAAFDFVHPGYNVRPTELTGAVGVEQMKKLGKILNVRQANARKFVELLKQFSWVAPQKVTAHAEHSWMGLPMLVETPAIRDRLSAELTRFGVEHRPILCGNFARTRMASACRVETPVPLTGADHLASCGLFVGNHPRPIDLELTVFEAALQEVDSQLSRGVA